MFKAIMRKSHRGSVLEKKQQDDRADSAVTEVQKNYMEVKTWYVMRPASCSSTKDFWYCEDTGSANVHLFFDTTWKCIIATSSMESFVSELKRQIENPRIAITDGLHVLGSSSLCAMLHKKIHPYGLIICGSNAAQPHEPHEPHHGQLEWMHVATFAQQFNRHISDMYSVWDSSVLKSTETFRIIECNWHLCVHCKCAGVNVQTVVECVNEIVENHEKRFVLSDALRKIVDLYQKE